MIFEVKFKVRSNLSCILTKILRIIYICWIVIDILNLDIFISLIMATRIAEILQFNKFLNQFILVSLNKLSMFSEICLKIN